MERASPETWNGFQARLGKVRAWLADPSAPPPWDPPEPNLKWLHQCVVHWVGHPGTADLEEREGLQVLRDLRAARQLRPRNAAIDEEVFTRELAMISDLRKAGLVATAGQVLDEFVIPASGPGDPQWSSVCTAAAYVHRRAFRWNEAQAWLERAAVAAASVEQRLFVAVGRASLAFERGLPDLAIEAVREAEKLARSTESVLAQHAALFVALRLDTVLNRPLDAIARWQEFATGPIKSRLEREDDGPRLVSQLAIRAAMAVLQDPGAEGPDAARAVAWLEAALRPEEASRDEQRLARNVLLSHLLHRGRLDEAARVLAQARADLEALAGGDATLDERSLHLAALAVRHAVLAEAPARDLAERHAALQRLFDAMLARWAEQPAARSGLGPLFFADRRMALAELIGATLVLEAEGDPMASALRHVIRAQALGSLARELGATEVTSADVQATLTTPGRGLLVFVPGAGTSHVFVIDADRIRHVGIAAGAFSIDRLRQRLLFAMQAVRSGGEALRGELAGARTALSRTLLPDALLEMTSAWRHVTVVGLESLGYVPFEFLERDGGRALGIEQSVSYLPSLPAGVWLARQRPARAPRPPEQGRVLLVACPDLPVEQGAGARPPLPFEAGERAQLAGGLAAASVAWLTGDEAGFAGILEQGPASFDALQILAHGVRDESRDDPQGIALPGGHLWGPEFERHALPGLVVLTACRAGNGRLRRGDDGRHLWSGAALVGGSRAAVLPWLEVDYRAALAFSTALHEELWNEGVAPEEALRRARVQCVADDPGAMDPYLFHLVGLGEVPLASPAPSKPLGWWWLAIASAAAALAMVWWLRDRRRARLAPDRGLVRRR